MMTEMSTTASLTPSFVLLLLLLCGMLAPSWQQIDQLSSSPHLDGQGASIAMSFSSPAGSSSSSSSSGSGSTSTADYLASLTAEKMAAMTPEERMHVQRLMEQQQQQHNLMLQQLEQQIQHGPAALTQPLPPPPSPSSSFPMAPPPPLPPSPPQPRPLPPPTSPLVVSGANAAGNPPRLQNVSPDKPPLSPFPLPPPPGAATVEPLQPAAVASSGGRLIGSSMAGGSPTGPTAIPPNNLPEFLASIRAAGSPGQQSVAFPPELQLTAREKQVLLQHGLPPSARSPSQQPVSPEALARLLVAEASKRGASPRGQPSSLRGLLEAAKRAGGVGVGAGAGGGILSGAGFPGGASHVCPKVSKGSVCSGRFFRCQQNQQCASGAMCCPDTCGMICQTAVPADGAILPGSLLVPACINPSCGNRGLFGQAPKTENDCDAIKACRAGWSCCFNGCRNMCRGDGGVGGGAGGGGRGSSSNNSGGGGGKGLGNFFSSSSGKMNKNLMLMMMAAGGS